MAYTQANLDDLRAAIGSGSLSVGAGDKRVTYRSLKDMLAIEALMAAELDVTPVTQLFGNSRVSLVEHSRD